MKSTRKLLEPFKNQILKETAEHGQGAGIRLADKLVGGYKGYGFRQWLKNEAGDENFGLHPTNPKSIRSNYFILQTRLEQAFIQTISNLEIIADRERENEELEKEIRLLKFKIMEAHRRGEVSKPEPVKQRPCNNWGRADASAYY
jgi:hypothetical protein